MQSHTIISTPINTWTQAHSTVTHLIVWNNTLWSASNDSTIKQWSANGQCLQTLVGHSDSVLYLYVWKDLLHSASYDKTIRVWDFNGTLLRTLQGHTEYVRCLTSWRDFLVSCSRDDTVRAWNDQGECVAQWRVSLFQTLIVWKEMLCTGHWNGSIQLWNEFQVCYNTFKHPDNCAVYSLVTHADHLFAGIIVQVLFCVNLL